MCRQTAAILTRTELPTTPGISGRWRPFIRLICFFIGAELEAFDHAIVTAYRWPPDALGDELRNAGFDVIETHTRTGSAPVPRPHGSILARLSE
jgi:hypothetical protein